MSQFSDQQLAYMRSQVAKFLKDTCEIRRPNGGKDPYGNSLDGDTVVATDVACRLLPLSRQEQAAMVGDVEMGRVYYRVILGQDSPVQDNDVLLIGGDRYEGLQVEDAQTDRVDIRVRVSKLGA